MSDSHTTLIGRVEFHLDLIANSKRNNLLGFIFFPAGAEECPPLCTCRRHFIYQLVIPQSLTCLVCDAVRFSIPVRVMDPYSSIYDCCSDSVSIRSNTTSTSAIGIIASTSNTTMSTQQRQQEQHHYKILELHGQHSLCIEHEDDIMTLSTFLSQTTTESFLSLSQLVTLERSNSFIIDSASPSPQITSPSRGQIRLKDTSTSPLKKRPKHKQKYFHLMACIDAISPIITAHPKDPFALIELYEDVISSPSSSSTTLSPMSIPLSAVVVLKGRDALSCHAAIQPGSLLFLHHVQRIKWHVPSSFMKQCQEQEQKKDHEEQKMSHTSSIDKTHEWMKYRHLLHRVPSHVFLVDTATSILWKNYNYYNYRNSNNSLPYLNSNLLEPPFPSTPYPLVTIQGIVSFVSCTSLPRTTTPEDHHHHHHNHRTNKQIIQYILLDTKPLPSKVYLIYYPLSPHVLCGLHKGAMVRATNIHRIDIPPSSHEEQYSSSSSPYAYFVACLRSTVSIIQVSISTIQLDSVQVDHNHFNYHQFSYLSFSPYISFQNVLWLECVYEEWYLQNIVKSAKKKNLHNSIHNHLIQLLEGIISDPARGKSAQRHIYKDRDPYAEFFNHACELYHPKDVNDDDCIRLNLYPSLPYIHGLKDIRTACIHAITQALDDSGQSIIKDTLTELGKKYRMEIDSFNLKRYLDKGDTKQTYGNGTNDSLFTGGHAVELNSHSPSQPVILQDDNCQLACVPMSSSVQEIISKSPNLVCAINQLVLCRVGCVIITCHSLGKILAKADIPHLNNHIFQMASFPNGIENDLVGSSCFLVTGGVVLFISLQLHYDKLYCTSMGGFPTSRLRMEYDGIAQITITSTTRKTNLVYGSESLLKLDETQYPFVINQFSQTYQCSKGKRENIVVALSTVSESYPHRVIQFSTSFPAEQIISRFKSSIQCGDYSLFRDILVRENHIIILVCNLWLLHECGRTASLSSLHRDGCSQRITCRENRKMLRDIAVILPTQYQSGNSVLSCAFGDISTFSVPVSIHPMYITDIIRLSLHQPPRHLREPYVFLLPGARILTILFCKVETGCALCFAPVDPLISALNDQVQWKIIKDQDSALNDQVQWKINKDQDAPLREDLYQQNKRYGNPRCPSGCGSNHVSIIWQCSCIVDDGTGQAKLYADNGACVKLLGMQLNTSLIEACAWNEPFIFDYKQPPSPYLLDTINQVQMDITKQSCAVKQNIREHDKTFTDRLPERARAEYEFQRHCRMTNYPVRRIDLLCRKIRDGIRYSGKPAEVVSAVQEGSDIIRKNTELISFSRLDLKLVDCMRCDDPSWKVRDELRAHDLIFSNQQRSSLNEL